MISKQVQAHKERQKKYMSEWNSAVSSGKMISLTLAGEVESHKQDLILFKEYLEGDLSDVTFDLGLILRTNCKTLLNIHQKKVNQLKKDIKELEELIKNYG